MFEAKAQRLPFSKSNAAGGDGVTKYHFWPSDFLFFCREISVLEAGTLVY